MAPDSTSRGTIITSEKFRRLIQSPMTLDGQKRNKKRYILRKRISSTFEDLRMILDGNDEVMADYVRKMIEKHLGDICNGWGRK